MTVPVIELWTWQEPKWDIASRPRDLSLIEETWVGCPGLQSLYSRLHCELGAKDFVFCFLKYEYWLGLRTRRLWVLEVPECEVLRYVRTDPWHKLVQGQGGDLAEELWGNVLPSPGEVQAYRSANKLCEISALLPVPIANEWVTDRDKFNWGPAATRKIRPFDKLPTSIAEAEQFREEQAEKLKKNS